jgi:hypothetical protein
MIAAPTLALWWLNKDEKWYRDMPFPERFAYTHLSIGDQDIRIPRPYEWGNVFSVLPEALADWAYRQNPESVGEALKTIFNNTVPDPLNNPAFKVPWEEHGNEVGYTGIPIEGKADENLPAAERIGPNTTGVAKAIGSVTGPLFGYSPKMVDHAIKGVFGGLGGDVAALTGTGAKGRDFEPADIPIVGTLFKRGGKEGGNSKAVESVYAKAEEAVQRGNSKEHKESPREEFDRKRLSNATEVLTMLSRAMQSAKNTAQMKKLSAKRRDIAIDVDGGKPAPDAKDIKQFLEDAGLIRPK